MINSIRKELKGFGGKTKDINNIFKNLTTIRKGWGDMFTALGSKMDEKELAQFQKLFGQKFKGWLG